MKPIPQIIVLLLLAITANAQQKSKLNIDINGDGVKDNIVVTSDKITINNKSIPFYPDGTILDVRIVDINTADSFKEIEVEIEGPNLIDHSYFWYNAKKEILPVGDIQLSPKFLGNGIAYGGLWAGFYARTEKFVLNNQHVFERVRGDMQYVGKDYKVHSSFVIYNEFDEKSKPLATLSPQSTITIVAAYKDQWVLIKSSNGILGWAKITNISLENFTMAG